MEKVKKFKQGCFLACLYSFLRDNSYASFSLQEFHDQIFSKKLCDEKGVVQFGQESVVCSNYCVEFIPVDYQWPVCNYLKDGSLLIFLTKKPYHCVRFAFQDEPGKIVCMDPDYGALRYYDKPNLEVRGPSYVRLIIPMKEDS